VWYSRDDLLWQDMCSHHKGLCSQAVVDAVDLARRSNVSGNHVGLMFAACEFSPNGCQTGFGGALIWGDGKSLAFNDHKEVHLPSSFAVAHNISAGVPFAPGTEYTALDLFSGCNSFAGNTPVAMADGSSQPIDRVKPGESVKNALPGAEVGSTGQSHKVTQVHVTKTDRHYVDVTIRTNHGSQKIVGTAHHLYWDATSRSWTRADQLRVGDELQSSAGRTVRIAALHAHVAGIITYNLTVEGVHTYYVLAGDTPVLVHNTSCKSFGRLSPSGRMDIPNESGVYRIETNDGTVYVGKATDIHSRFHGAFTKGGALYDAGYRKEDVRALDWMEMPGATDEELFDMENQWIEYEGGIGNLANRINSPGAP